MAADQHIPVLLEPILSMSAELEHEAQFYLDATLGRGGHLRAMLEKFPRLKAVAIDRDQAALDFAQKEFATELQSGRLRLIHGDYKQISADENRLLECTGGRGFDLILADLGVSSPQLDEAERGFSFYHDGPLDMRMDQSRGPTAADILNNWSDRDLLRLFREYGEIRQPTKVVNAIIRDRREKPFTRTSQLAGLIERVEGWRKKGFHPATLYFLALRLETNQELEDLDGGIQNLVRLLSDKGRLMVITFHSLEDRIVKYTLKGCEHLGFAVNKKVVQPTREEQQTNARARSAKLRVFQRGPRDVKRKYPKS